MLRIYRVALLVLAFASFLARAQEATPEPSIDAPPPPSLPSVPDAVQFYKLKQVTVVYPTGPGEDVERNRRSAQQRARYLELVRGMRAHEVADAALGAEDKAGNLLVLGWGNSAFSTLDALDRPFLRTEKVLAFLGLEPVGLDIDLMFYAHSPFNPKSFVFFWSRIDAEMDRFQVLPLLGSNWAMFRDFTVVQQGMFEPGTTWPLKRNPLAEVNRTERFAELDADHQIAHSKHYDVVYPGAQGTSAEPIGAILQAREAAYARAIQVVGAPADGFRIKVFVYKDVEEKKERTGIEDVVHSNPRRGEIHMIERLARNPAAHEDIHVIARQVLGPCYLTSLYEGLALAEDGTYGGTELDLHAALLADRDKIPALEMLLTEPTFRALPDALAYPSSALMIEWIRTLGKDALAKTYSLADGGLDGFARALGRPRDSLDASFRDRVRERGRPRKSDVTFLKEQAEAQERYQMGDYPGVAAALTRALKLKPGDPQTLFNLASAQMRSSSYEDAIKNLRKILTLTLPAKDAHLAVFSHYQLGRTFDVQGKREDALAEYRKVLEMPDARDAHRLAREAIETPVTKERLD